MLKEGTEKELRLDMEGHCKVILDSVACKWEGQVQEIEKREWEVPEKNSNSLKNTIEEMV